MRNPKIKKVSLGENKPSQPNIDVRSLPGPKSDLKKKSELQLAKKIVRPRGPMSNQLDRFGRVAFNKNKELSLASLDVDKQNSVSASFGDKLLGVRPPNLNNENESAQQN